jgi:hypothetical protein
MLSGSTIVAGPAGAPGQVNRPSAAQPDPPTYPSTDWRKSGFNAQNKYATWWKDSGLHPAPHPIKESGPWQIGGIDGNINGLTYPQEKELPAWTDATWNQIGINHQLNAQTVMYNAVTLDSGGEYQQGAPAPGFETTTFERATNPNVDPTVKRSSYHILYYGHVVEKMRQLTYAGFGSYIVRDILSSKYDCGNDGFDGPVGDINIPSGDRRVTTTDDTSEAGLLTFDSNAPSYPLPVAATRLSPPTVNPTPINPNPPLSPISGGDDTTSPDDGGGTIVGGDDTISPSDDGGVDGTIGDSSSGGGISGDGGSGTIVGGGGSTIGGGGTIVGGL